MKCAFARAAIAIALLTAASAASAQSPALQLHPGLQVNFSIYDGYTKTGTYLGDYDQIHVVTQVSNGGYSYQYRFTGPAPNTGSQTVSAEDNKHGTMLREYWSSGDESAK